MNSTNPHRFPRPPTLPQSKIQIQSQRERDFTESGHLTFASMVGRTGGQSTSFGTTNEKEESGSPGSFTTSLLSIAKMVPGKQRRVSNPQGIGEGQVVDTSTTRESSIDTLVHGDWRKQPSIAAAEAPHTSDTAKSMIFRRTIAVPSSRLVQRSSSIFAPEKIEGATEGSGISASKNDDFLFFKNRNMPPLMEALTKKEMEAPRPGHKAYSTEILGFPDQQQDEKNGCIDDLQQGGWASDYGEKEISSRKIPMGKKMDPTAMFQPSQAPGADDSTGFTHLTPLIPVNDSAGILRAAAVPFRPKQVSNAPALSLKAQLGGNTSTGINSTSKLQTRSDPFAHLLPESFYGKAFRSSAANSVSSSNATDIQKRKHEESSQVLKTPGEGFSASEGSGEIVHRKSDLGDAGISQLWDFPGKGDDSQTIRSTPLGLSGPNNVHFNPNAESFLALKSASGATPSPSKISSGRITVRDEAQEQIVPIPRNSPNSDLQVVELLEMKAIVLSKSESEIVTTLSVEPSIGDYIKHSAVKVGPVPQMDQRGRRGAISMQGTVKRIGNGDTGGGRSKDSVTESQGERLAVAEENEAWLKKWQELNGVIKIHVRGGKGSEDIECWPYPYSKPGVSEKEIATEPFRKLYEQLSSYMIGSDGTRSGRDCWGFGTRKNKSGYTPGKEPWFGGDNTSFFDMSFGINPGLATGKAPVGSTPRPSSTPAACAQTTLERPKATQVESGGLRDLVESSTPDYNDFSDNYRKSRAKTIQEWNSTPIYGSTSANALGSRANASRHASGISSGLFVYEKAGMETDGGGGSIISVRDSEMPGGAILMKQARLGNRFGAELASHNKVGSAAGPIGGNGWGSNVQQSQSYEDRVRRRKLEQKQELFGGVRKTGKLVFGSDEESDGM